MDIRFTAPGSTQHSSFLQLRRPAYSGTGNVEYTQPLPQSTMERNALCKTYDMTRDAGAARDRWAAEGEDWNRLEARFLSVK